MKKWFYPLQEVAEKRFDKMYPGCDRRCVYQIVTKGRVIEQWQVHTDAENVEDRVKDVLVSMIDHGKNNGTLLIYEMNFVASN